MKAEPVDKPGADGNADPFVQPLTVNRLAEKGPKTRQIPAWTLEKFDSSGDKGEIRTVVDREILNCWRF